MDESKGKSTPILSFFEDAIKNPRLVKLSDESLKELMLTYEIPIDQVEFVLSSRNNMDADALKSLFGSEGEIVCLPGVWSV